LPTTVLFAFLWSSDGLWAQRAKPKDAVVEPASKTVPVYDADPTHLWNRLYSAFYLRTDSGGKVYGQDELDPLLWPDSKVFLVGRHHQQVVALLDEFLARDGDRLVQDPLKRALLQRDLWAIFDWLANSYAVYQTVKDGFEPERRALQTRLARVIRRLALSDAEMERLTDNYAAALAARAFPPRHNADRPGEAFLPPDLFQADGPWVVLGQHLRPAAPEHTCFARGRSVFLVFLNLPAGRKATLAYLAKLGAFPRPLVPGEAGLGSALSLELPQFPVGTQVALAREMLLINDEGKITPTRLIESLQIRVYRQIPDYIREEMRGKQDFYEFRIRRRELFAGERGGLHAVGPDEREFLLLNPHPHDELEAGSEASQLTPILQSCAGCHGGTLGQLGGIHTVVSYRNSLRADGPILPPRLRPYERGQQEEAVIIWKRKDYSWGLLEGLMNGTQRHGN
jgi:hypothetical protein